jgi:transposase
MRFIGLDVHKRLIEVCIIDADGATLDSFRFNLNLASLHAFGKRHLDHDCQVALEATTNSWAVVDVLSEYCPNIVVSNPMRTKLIALSRVKTDKVDALALAQLLRCQFLPSVWIPDANTRNERTLASRRSALTRQSIALKNRIHSVLHQRLIEAPSELFSVAGLSWLKALELNPVARGEIDSLLRIREALLIEQNALKVELNRSAFVSESIKLLITLPGVDVTTAQAIMAAIGDIARFDSDRKLAAYFGLTPSVHQSAEHCYHGRITKQGNSNVRWLLVQAAQKASDHPGPLGHQFQRLLRKKNRSVAVVAIAHKLAILIWHLLTKKTPYRYAIPRVVEHKLQKLRVSQIGKRKSGPKAGEPQAKTRGSGVRTRKINALNDVLKAESLPVTTIAPKGEVRVIEDLGLTEFAQQIQTTRRVLKRSANDATKLRPNTAPSINDQAPNSSVRSGTQKINTNANPSGAANATQRDQSTNHSLNMKKPKAPDRVATSPA